MSWVCLTIFKNLNFNVNVSVQLAHITTWHNTKHLNLLADIEFNNTLLLHDTIIAFRESARRVLGYAGRKA